MPRKSSRERIAEGYVMKAVRERTDERSLAFWATLSPGQRMSFYDAAIADHRVAHAWENGFINNKLGQGTAEGRGGCLFMAIEAAYRTSDQYWEEVQAFRDAYDAEPLACMVCGGEFRRDGDVTSYGDRAICHRCHWEKYPASAAMLDIPRPAAAEPDMETLS